MNEYRPVNRSHCGIPGSDDGGAALLLASACRCSHLTTGIVVRRRRPPSAPIAIVGERSCDSSRAGREGTGCGEPESITTGRGSMDCGSPHSVAPPHMIDFIESLSSGAFALATANRAPR
jgi:hypothetical protein